ncbi:MAG: DUF899 family protein [Silvibacterium sp.]
MELRRHIERVAALRRTLPSGGGIPEGYTIGGHNGAVRFSQLFGDKDALSCLQEFIFHRGSRLNRNAPIPLCLLQSAERIRTAPARVRERRKAFELLPARRTNSSWEGLVTCRRAPGLMP